MRASRSFAAALWVAMTACSANTTLSPTHAAALADSVRVFSAAIAREVTRGGPAGWRGVLADSASFFMASDGRLVFASGAAAKLGVDDLVHSISHIELQWGDSVRVDPLAPGLAMIAAPYHEVMVDTAGVRVEERGYFTGLAQYGASGWQLRDAHWSVAPPQPTARCRDGSYSYSQTHSGTCSSHGGVAQWL